MLGGPQPRLYSLEKISDRLDTGDHPPSQTATSVGPATKVIRLSSSGGLLDSSLEGILPHPPADFNLLWHLNFLRGAYREFSFQFLSLSLSEFPFVCGGHGTHYFSSLPELS